MGALKMLHLNMMTCIFHVFSRSIEVCWLTLPMGAIKMIHLSMMTCKSMSTYITQYLTYLTYWNPEVCWLTSPMGAIKYASFEYADLQKYVNLHHPVSFTYWNPEVCWLASSMCDHDPMKYADLHHPFVLQILWSMLSYITFILLWFLKSWHNRLV